MLYKNGKNGQFISRKEANEILKSLKRPNDFSLLDSETGFFDAWALGPIIETRDSGLLDQSNAAEIKNRLEMHAEFADSWKISNCSHWASGWVDHLSYRVIQARTDKVITFDPIVFFIQDIFARLKNYPILNEEDYSSREFEATLENIRDAVRYFVRRMDIDYTLPENYEYSLYCWFWDGDQCAVENVNDRGGYPDDIQLSSAFEALGWL